MSNISRKYTVNRFYLHVYLFLCMYCLNVFCRLWQRCWKWRCVQNLQEVRNIADWKWICVFSRVFVAWEQKNSKLIHLSNCTCINFLKTLRSVSYFFLKILFFYRVRLPLTIMPRVPLVYVNKTIVRSETFSISIFSNDYYFYLR